MNIAASGYCLSIIRKTVEFGCLNEKIDSKNQASFSLILTDEGLALESQSTHQIQYYYG